MLLLLQTAATGVTGQRLEWAVGARSKITAVEARCTPGVASIQLAVGDRDKPYNAVLLARGDQDRGGDQIHWSGEMIVEPTETIFALFYGAAATDTLELVVHHEWERRP